jgi:hypothetical protein
MAIKEPISTTNSALGSYHWFHTLIARMKHIGEFIKKHDNIDPSLLKAWGEELRRCSDELASGFSLINKE